MNTAKLNDWLQIAAAVGIIAGLILVAYEIRISNRIGIEQGNAAAIERWAANGEIVLTSNVSELFVRAYESEELSRAEAVQLNALSGSFLNALEYDMLLIETKTWEASSGTGGMYRNAIQFFLGSEHARRRWEVNRNGYSPSVVAIVDQALAAPEQRDVLAYLDYIRGATDRLE